MSYLNTPNPNPNPNPTPSPNPTTTHHSLQPSENRTLLPEDATLPSPLGGVGLGSFSFLPSPNSASKAKLPPFSPSANSLSLGSGFDDHDHDQVRVHASHLETPLGIQVAGSSQRPFGLGLVENDKFHEESPRQSGFQRGILFGNDDPGYIEQEQYQPTNPLPLAHTASSSSSDWRYMPDATRAVLPATPPVPLLPDPVADKNSAVELQKRYKELELGSTVKLCQEEGCGRMERRGGRCLAHNATACGPACPRPSRIDGRCMLHLHQSIKAWSKEGEKPTQFMQNFEPKVAPFCWPDDIVAKDLVDPKKLPPGVAAIAARIGEPKKGLNARRVRRRKDPKSPKFTNTYVRTANYSHADVKRTADDVWQLPEDGVKLLFITYKKLLGGQIKSGLAMEGSKQIKTPQMCLIQEEEIRCLPYGFMVVPRADSDSKLYIAPDGRQFTSVAEILRKLEPQVAIARLSMSASEFYCYMEGAMEAAEAVTWKNKLLSGELVDMSVRLESYKMVKKFIGINSCRVKLTTTAVAVSCLPVVLKYANGEATVKINVKVAVPENKPAEI